MFLRSKSTQEKYNTNQSQYTNFSQTKDYREDEEKIMRMYEHWYIIPNLFPYDKVAQVHDMLVPKRVFGKMADCTQGEWGEYKKIINQLEAEAYYDVMLENFSKHRSICKHLHLHLIIWKELS